MSGRHFISYSRAEAANFALSLSMELAAGAPSFKTWLDTQDLKAAENYEDQIEEAISSCESFLFVISHDSVNPASPCRKELNYAIECKKHVIPILLHKDARTPFALTKMQCIDFSTDAAAAMARLRRHIHEMSGPAADLYRMKTRLAEAERQLPRAADAAARAALEEEIKRLKTEFAYEQVVRSDDHGKWIGAAREQLKQALEALSGHSDLSESVYELITLAIHLGAPVYNAGSHIGCAYIYDYTGRMILRLLAAPEGQAPLYKSLAARLKKVSFESIAPEAANRRAWDLRHAFDDILEMLVKDAQQAP
jgi:hypothetical protein